MDANIDFIDFTDSKVRFRSIHRTTHNARLYVKVEPFLYEDCFNPMLLRKLELAPDYGHGMVKLEGEPIGTGFGRPAKAIVPIDSLPQELRDLLRMPHWSREDRAKMIERYGERIVRWSLPA